MNNKLIDIVYIVTNDLYNEFEQICYEQKLKRVICYPSKVKRFLCFKYKTKAQYLMIDCSQEECLISHQLLMAKEIDNYCLFVDFNKERE